MPNNLSWGDFKRIVEAQGVDDDVLISSIDWYDYYFPFFDGEGIGCLKTSEDETINDYYKCLEESGTVCLKRPEVLKKIRRK